MLDKLLMTLGSYTERTKWSSQNRSFDTAHWLSLHTSSLTSRANARSKAHTVATANSNNLLSTNPATRQPYETVSEFCQRVAPSKTRLSSTIQWIWIYATKNDASGGQVAIADEKEPSSRDLTRLIDRGQELLSEFNIEKDKITREMSGTSNLTRTLNQSRTKLVTEIHELARTCNVTSGKVRLPCHLLKRSLLNLAVDVIPLTIRHRHNMVDDRSRHSLKPPRSNFKSITSKSR